jgi:signal transduction histidine kinase
MPTDSRTSAASAPDRSVLVTDGQELVLPRPPGVFRRYWAKHPGIADALIAGLYLAFMAATIAVNATSAGASRLEIGVHSTVVLVAAAALLVRRTHPVLPLAVGVMISLVSFPAYGQGNLFAVILALYAVAVYRSSRAAWAGFGISLATSSLGAWLAEQSASNAAYTIVSISAASDTGEATQRIVSWPVVSLQYALGLLLATLIGANIGNRRRYLAALLNRAAQLARERDQQAIIAAATERSRIAREMHDVVAHSLSIVVSLADGAAAIVPRDPARAQEAMLTVGETGRQALAEMRRLLGVLGDADSTPAPLAPQPGLAQIDGLIEQFRDAALPVTYNATGVRPTDEGLQLALYRIVQESLTNALRHARSATTVTVNVDYGSDRVLLEVTDDGRAAHSSGGAGTTLSGTARADTAPAGADVPGGGRGVVGIRDRAALFGGTATAGPHTIGGWRVSVTIPTPVTQ